MKRTFFIVLWVFVAYCIGAFLQGVILFSILLIEPQRPLRSHSMADVWGGYGWILAVLLMPLALFLGLKGKLPGTASAPQKQ